MKEGGKELSKQLAFMVQTFGAEVVLPHLCRFARRCLVEQVEPPLLRVSHLTVLTAPKKPNLYRIRKIHQS